MPLKAGGWHPDCQSVHGGVSYRHYGAAINGYRRPAGLTLAEEVPAHVRGYLGEELDFEVLKHSYSKGDLSGFSLVSLF